MNSDSNELLIENREMLGSTWLFSGATTKNIEASSKKFIIQTFPSGYTVLRADESCKTMYIVLRGKVKAIDVTVDGKETVLAIHGEGESFGEIALLDGLTSPADVVTIEHSTLAIISKAVFQSLISSNQVVVSNVISMLCRKLRESWANNAVLAGTHRSAIEKIRAMLDQLSRKHGSRIKQGVLIDIKLTHQTLADMTGLTRAYVTRTLSELKNRGIISVVKTRKGNRILIRQPL